MEQVKPQHLLFFVDDEMKKSLVSGAIVSFIGTLEAGWRGGVRVRIQK